MTKKSSTERFTEKQQMSDEMRQAIERLITAIKNEGPVPQYHRHVMRKHRDEWPRLWGAIDEIVALYGDDSK